MKRIGVGLALLVGLAILLTACGNQSNSPVKDQGIKLQQAVSDGAIGRINQTEPPPVLTDSSDAHNQRIFYTEQSDPNKVEYLELLSYTGQPIAHFTIKGQVSSMNTQETSPTQAYCVSGEKEKACTTVDQPDPNGVYVGADQAHFAITTNGALIEWEGNFITSDQPFSTKTPVALSLNESVAPTTTDTSHVAQGALLPNGRSH